MTGIARDRKELEIGRSGCRSCRSDCGSLSRFVKHSIGELLTTPISRGHAAILAALAALVMPVPIGVVGHPRAVGVQDQVCNWH